MYEKFLIYWKLCHIAMYKDREKYIFMIQNRYSQKKTDIFNICVMMLAQYSQVPDSVSFVALSSQYLHRLIQSSLIILLIGQMPFIYIFF